MERKVSCFWEEPQVAQGYRTGISLHSHTNHSKESLSFVSQFIERQPMLKRWMDGEKDRCSRIDNGRVDLKNAYWTPPLAPQAALQLEKEQIEKTLGLASLISITDHDTIGAPVLLRMTPEGREVPISVEWTAPCGEAVFHFGIHNLPVREAEEAMAQMREYTAQPRPERFTELLAWLDSQQDVLVILNHPLWDLARIGSVRHEQAFRTLLAGEGKYIHALELSGIRSWEENQAVRRLAEEFDQMVVSGGDRHGTEPNATLNLSNAESFEEFVHEIRRERRGHVLVMPQYTDPKPMRLLQTVLAAVREYPDKPVGSQRWDERTFHPDRDGSIQPLVKQWVKPPVYITGFFAVLHLLDVVPVRQALQLILRQPQKMFVAPLSGREEIAQ